MKILESDDMKLIFRTGSVDETNSKSTMGRKYCFHSVKCSFRTDGYEDRHRRSIRFVKNRQDRFSARMLDFSIVSITRIGNRGVSLPDGFLRNLPASASRNKRLSSVYEVYVPKDWSSHEIDF